MKEAEIIKYCKQKNRLAQKALFDKYYQTAYHITYRYLGNHEDVEDTLSKVFTNVFRNIIKFENRGDNSFSKWFTRIAINEALKFLRQKRHVSITNDFSRVEDFQIYLELDFLDLELVYEMINSLSVEQRLVFNMFEIDGYSHKEISEKLNIAENTSKSHLFRAKKQLRQHLKKFMNYERK